MIMSISTNGIGNIDLTSATSRAKSKDEEKNADAFASLMNMTAAKQSEPANIDAEAGGEAVEVQETSKNQYEKDTYEYTKDVSEKNVDEKLEKVSEPETMDKTQDTKVGVEDADLKSEEKLEEIVVILNTIKKVIMDALNLTEEELDATLVEGNLNIYDLLNQDVLKSFVLTQENATEVDILINEDLAKLLNDITAEINSVLEDSNINVQEFMDVIEDVKEQLDTYLQQEQIVTQDVKTVSEKIEAPDKPAEVVEAKDTNVVINKKTADETVTISETNADNTIDSSSGQSEAQTGSFSFNQETAQTNIMNNLNQAINNAFATTDVNSAVSYVDGVTEADIVRQIIDEIKVNITKETTSLEVQLNPENLGKVQINVASKEGVLQAQIIAETETAKHAIEQSLAVLKETFNNQELKVEAIEVMVASYEFFNQNNDGAYENEEQANTTKKTSLNIGEILGEEELTEEEQIQVEMMRAQGNSVSYSI